MKRSVPLTADDRQRLCFILFNTPQIAANDAEIAGTLCMDLRHVWLNREIWESRGSPGLQELGAFE